LAPAPAPTNETITLTVPKGAAVVQVVLDKEVRIQKVGQAVHGRVAEPVYAFDKLVVPEEPKLQARLLGSKAFLAENALLMH